MREFYSSAEVLALYSTAPAESSPFTTVISVAKQPVTTDVNLSTFPMNVYQYLIYVAQIKPSGRVTLRKFSL